MILKLIIFTGMRKCRNKTTVDHETTFSGIHQVHFLFCSTTGIVSLPISAERIVIRL